MNIKLLEEAIFKIKAIIDKADNDDHKELSLLIKDLDEARLTIFVKTADAKPFLERCHETAGALRDAVDKEKAWGEESKRAFAAFERAVSKLRNTILVRTQKAT